MKDDKSYMQLALHLARRGEGYTHPNPPVGAVITKNGKIIGQGYHRKAGMPHAEVEAIRDAGGETKDSTLHVTLEPCCTYGKTPPCTNAIIDAGIRRVVVAVQDPNPKHKGKAVRLLRRKGIVVDFCEKNDEYIELIAPFAKWVSTGRPHITLKLAMSIDGRIADSKGQSRWITCEKSRAIVQSLRMRVDAVMVGSGTAIKDDPSLMTASREDNTLTRIIVDSSGKVSPGAKVFNDSNAISTILATTNRCHESRVPKYKNNGARVWTLQSSAGRVSIPRLLRKIGQAGLMHILCEGGGELAYSLIKEGAVDDYVFFVAPRILGGKHSVPSIGGDGWLLPDSPVLDFKSIEKVGTDIVIRARPLNNSV